MNDSVSTVFLDEDGEEFVAIKEDAGVNEWLVNYSVDKKCLQNSKSTENCVTKTNQCDSSETNAENDLDLVDRLINEVKQRQKSREIFPIVCQLCQYQFSQLNYLISHLRTVHAALKPFKCSICDANFTTRNSLKCHVMRHNRSYAHVCTVCDAGFMSSWGLKQHQKIHERILFKCDLCPRKFPSQLCLSEHHIQAHPKLSERIKRSMSTMTGNCAKMSSLSRDTTSNMDNPSVQTVTKEKMNGASVDTTSSNLSKPVGETGQKRFSAMKRKSAKRTKTAEPTVVRRPILPKPNHQELSVVRIQQSMIFDSVNDCSQPMMNCGRELEFMSAGRMADESDDDCDYSVKLNDHSIADISLMSQLDGVQTDYPMFIDGLMIDESV